MSSKDKTFDTLKSALGLDWDQAGARRRSQQVKALKTATRGFLLGRDIADASQFWSAVCKTVVHVASSNRAHSSRVTRRKVRGRRMRRPTLEVLRAALHIFVEKAVELSWRSLACSCVLPANTALRGRLNFLEMYGKTPYIIGSHGGRHATDRYPQIRKAGEGRAH